ncbi:hypothetical protein AB0442_35550 [Kitasatospora sp. NPDC085895]|uniref:hypothetical protein n=1 Tax=Kitasatospora sp. NPDC085895 TaxID=3155057 RepID=UPI0034506F47
MENDLHGEALIERVIAKVSADGWETADMPDLDDEPVPLPAGTLAALRLPDGRPLPPSLRRWLAFDSSLPVGLGWYPEALAPDLAGAPLSETVDELYGFGSDEEAWSKTFAEFEPLLPGRCLPLVGGCDSRRLLYLGEPDSAGEYPVLVTDMDDLPYVAVMYPGLDVYLADEAGLLDRGFDSYTGLMDHPVYGARMREHAERTRLGTEGLEIQDLYAQDGDEAEGA